MLGRSISGEDSAICKSLRLYDTNIRLSERFKSRKIRFSNHGGKRRFIESVVARAICYGTHDNTYEDMTKGKRESKK